MSNDETSRQRLAGKNAIVTGAASGIGRETALRYAQEGAAVLAADRNEEGLSKLRSEIQALGGVCHQHTTDVTSADSVSALFEKVDQVFTELNILVNNAGIDIPGHIKDFAEDDWDRQMNVNVKSVYLMSKAAWPRLVSAKNAAIVNTASIGGMWALPSDTTYCTTKAAVIMLTKGMALDGASDHIRVNCVAPGYIWTPMVQEFFSNLEDPEAERMSATAMQPLGRLGAPRDIADAFVYLASDDAQWVTGSTLTVDGGLTAGIWQPASA